MVRKKRRPPARTAGESPESPELVEDDPFTLALSEFDVDEGIQLQIYRLDPMTGKPRYVKAVPVVKGLHGLDWLQRMFGAGDYLLRFYDSEGKSRNQSISIDDDPTTRKREAEPASTAQANPSRDELVAILREQNLVLLKSVLEGRSGSTSAAGENPVMMKILEALLPKALEKPDISGSLLGMLERGIELAMDAKGDEGGVGSIVRTLAKELGPALQEYARERARVTSPPRPGPVYSAPPPPPPMAIPAGASSTTPPAAPTNGAPSSPAPLSQEDAGKAMVEGTVRFGAELVEQAWQKKETPRDVADWILGEIPANYYEHLAALTYDRVVALDQRYARIDRDWISTVLAHLHEEAQPPEDGGGEDEHAEESA